MTGLLVLGIIGLILYFLYVIAIKALLWEIIRELRRKNGKND